MTAQVITKFLLRKVYQPLKIRMLLKITSILLVDIMSDLITVDNGGFELTTVILKIQTKRLIKQVSQVSATRIRVLKSK